MVCVNSPLWLKVDWSRNTNQSKRSIKRTHKTIAYKDTHLAISECVSLQFPIVRMLNKVCTVVMPTKQLKKHSPKWFLCTFYPQPCTWLKKCTPTLLKKGFDVAFEFVKMVLT